MIHIMGKTPLIGSEILFVAPPRALLDANAETRNRSFPGSVTPSLVLDRREVTQKGQEAVTQVTIGTCFGPGESRIWGLSAGSDAVQYLYKSWPRQQSKELLSPDGSCKTTIRRFPSSLNMMRPARKSQHTIRYTKRLT